MRSPIFVCQFICLCLFIHPLSAEQPVADTTKVRVAAISLEPIKFDLTTNTESLVAAFRKAAEGGAQIAVAPEGVLEGYVVNEIIAGQSDAEQMRQVAVTVDSPTIQRFQSLARELDICLAFGFAERIEDDVFNCAVFIDNQGKICGKYHKMQFAEGYSDRWWFNRLGQQSRAFDTPFGRCGILICNDRWNPALAQIPALDGAQFLIIPAFGSTSKSQDEAVLARSGETGLPVMEANVGVTLIADSGRLIAADRHRNGITFGEISIPPPQPIDQAQRDRVERTFLAWRKKEMPIRLVAHLAKSNRVSASRSNDGIDWYSVQDIGIEGKAWDDTESFFDRLPAKAKDSVRPPVWSLSHDSAGMCVRFESDARELRAQWSLRRKGLARPHMPATGVSGLDLYVRHDGRWRWLAVGQPKSQSNQATLIKSMPAGRREYLLYLPLYNGIESLEIGVSAGASLWRKSPPQNCRPIVFWGTSITQGACASRPGMCHVAILGRKFDRPVINLGFSGNGRMEVEVAQLLAEIDAAVFVIDCLPNITADAITLRTRSAVEAIRAKRPDTPILLVEDRTYANTFLSESKQLRHRTSRAALRNQFDQMRRDGIANLHYLSGDRLLGSDGEDTVDSSHPTDLGFMRQADAFAAALRPLIRDHPPIDRWWKGNLHTHTLWSDGNDFPEMVADWYRNHGYHFLALSDHNILSEGTKWLKLDRIEARSGKAALDKYIARFGHRWVETRGSRDQGTMEVRLKPLAEIRTLVEASGEFLMIPSEEITDRGAHINATNIAEVIQPQGGNSVRETIQNNLRAVAAQSKRLGRPIIPHLNHPNLGDKGISAEDLAALIQDEFFEVFNGVEGDGDLGSDRRHSLETLWDITSTLRISKFHAPPMFALATDDSHNYHGKPKASPGRGWIMLRAPHLSPESILAAMKRGDFYASSGVMLRRVEYDSQSKIFTVEIEPDGDAQFTTEFIGTPMNFDRTTEPRVDENGESIPGTLDYSTDVGKVFASQTGTVATYQLTGEELYVRATITSDQAPQNPTSESPRAKAWTQPVGWRANITPE